MPDYPEITWFEDGVEKHARWRSEGDLPPARRIQVVDDSLKADQAWRLAAEGTALLWRGDFQNARQLLQAMARRIDRKPLRATDNLTERFHLYRQAQLQRARALNMLLIPFEAGHQVPLRRAPDVRLACQEVYGEANEPYIASLRELLGIIGAHQWRLRGVEVPQAGGRIHPHYGVFAPVRGEYVNLVASAPLPACTLAFDIGTGTGVLAAVLAQRGVERVVATDLNPRALACAHDNIARLDLTERVDIVKADLFPPGRAPLIVCNPPWLPGRARTTLEQAVYDPDSAMLRGFLMGLSSHLTDQGEGWLILSDLAEHLGLRTRAELLGWIDTAGLTVIERHDIRPQHDRVRDRDDPLYAARAQELTSLWRLTKRKDTHS